MIGHRTYASLSLRIIIGMACLVVMSIPSLAGENVTLYDSAGKVIKPSQLDRVSISKSCGDCHNVKDKAKSLHFNKGEANPDPDSSDCLSCHLPRKNAFNAKGEITKSVAVHDNCSCSNCHTDVADELSASVHGRSDRSPGDHPNCLSCHGGNPHSITPPSHMTGISKAAKCSGCHSDAMRMKPYGETPEAVTSYERSYHGVYLLRYGKTKSAQCTDCHGYHAVLAASDPASPVSGRNLNKACGACHSGATSGFSACGASHLDLAVQRTPILRWESVGFVVLTYGVMVGLLGMVALDLRRKVFDSRHRPKSGRLVASLEALSFCSMVAGLTMAVTGVRGAEWAWIAAVAIMAIAFAVYLVRVKPRKPAAKEKLYQRFTPCLRAQHICMVVSFTVLAVTGMPLKFAHVDWSHSFQLIFGGLYGARIAHRAAAILLTFTWLWHFVFIVYRSRKYSFSMNSWTMLPTRKDFADFLHTLKYDLGLADAPPQFGRFDFKQKFDYFAVYWGMPIMLLSGFVLWFPVYLGAKLPAISYALSYIAHSDEALLAVLAILMWHLYNAHFDPDHFPMNNVWYSGVLTESEMAAAHPLEKTAIDAGGKGS